MKFSEVMNFIFLEFFDFIDYDLYLVGYSDSWK